MNPDDLLELGLADGERVDVFSEWPGEPDRVLRNQRVVVVSDGARMRRRLLPGGQRAGLRCRAPPLGSNTPVSKAVIVRLEPVE